MLMLVTTATIKDLPPPVHARRVGVGRPNILTSKGPYVVDAKRTSCDPGREPGGVGSPAYIRVGFSVSPDHPGSHGAESHPGQGHQIGDQEVLSHGRHL